MCVTVCLCLCVCVCVYTCVHRVGSNIALTDSDAKTVAYPKLVPGIHGMFYANEVARDVSKQHIFIEPNVAVNKVKVVGALLHAAPCHKHDFWFVFPQKEKKVMAR